MFFCSLLLHQQMVQMCSFNQILSLSSFDLKDATADVITALYGICQHGHVTQMWYLIINGLLLAHDEKSPSLSAFVWVFLLFACFSICFPRWLGHALQYCSFICIQHIHLSSHNHLPPEVSVCLSAAYSPLCHFRVVSMRCRNLQISSFGPQHIRQDYPEAACGLSPCLSASSATAHQADRSAAHLTPAAFPGFHFSITSSKTGCQSENLSAIVKYPVKSEVEAWLSVFRTNLRYWHLIWVFLCKETFHSPAS